MTEFLYGQIQAAVNMRRAVAELSDEIRESGVIGAVYL